MLLVDGSDDAFHAWPATSTQWTEAMWFGAWLPELATSVYIYNWFRPAMGIYGGGCIVWNDKAHLPWEVPIYQYDVNRPILQDLDLRKLELDCGTRVTCLRDGWQYRIHFSNPRVRVELEFHASTPPELTQQHGTAEFFAGHLDQPGRYRGYVELEGHRHDIDCHGVRDRSWGPRVISDDMRLGYCHGESPELAFLAFSQPGGAEEPVFKGFLSMDGDRIDLLKGVRRVQFSDRRMTRIVLGLEDKKGRRLETEGVPLNYFLYLPYPNLLSRHYLVRWESAHGTFYGEEQDLWSVPLWRQQQTF
jgi:hypothetical protein